MKFTKSEKFEIFSLIAIIIHLGELKFKQKTKEGQIEYETMQGFYKKKVNISINKLF